MGIQTQICGVALLAVLFFLNLIQPNKEEVVVHKIYNFLFLSAFLCLMLDGYSIIVIRNANGEYGLYEKLICKSYLISLVGMAYFSFLYLSIDLNKNHSMISTVRVFFGIWSISFACAICALPISFFNDGTSIYTYNLSVYITYVACFGILISNFILLFRFKKHIKRRRWIAGVTWMFLWVSAAAIQALRNDLLLVGFSGALGVFVVFVLMETPDYLILTKTLKQLESSRLEAENANKAKSNFLAQMSHEIRTPINVVLGMNELILRESKEEETLKYAATAYSSGKSLLSIINDVLDISKIEAGKMEITEAEYELYSLISDCNNMSADRAQKKGLSFKIVVDENLPRKLFGDMFHLRQIIVNFITNAIKYTDEGSVELRFEEKREDDNFSLFISVKDTGIGLTDADRVKLFNSFQRFNLKKNQSIEGTGLGLSISKELADLMHGEINVESIYGKGSTFTCTIPQGIIDSTPIGKIELNNPLGSTELKAIKKFTTTNARIMVVDDMDVNLLVFVNLLKGHNLLIDEAKSGKECLELIQKEEYDIIFMDYMMPGMDGMETFQRMKETEHLNNNTPVVMLTANAIAGEKEKTLAEGFASYLTKPIQSDKLIDTLIQLLPAEKVTIDENAEEIVEDSNSKQITEIDSGLLDIKLGLSYTGNAEESYLEILKNYVSRGNETNEKIKKYFTDENWKDYVTIVHALKSSSLTVGARKLSDLAARLEQLGRNGDYNTIKEKNGSMLELFQKVLEVGKKQIESMSATEVEDIEEIEEVRETVEIPLEELKEKFEKLQTSLDSFDGDEIISICDELSNFCYNKIDLGQELLAVKNAAADYEYEQAKVAATSAINKILS